MNTPTPNLDLESRLRNAAQRSTPAHSIAESVLHQLPETEPLNPQPSANSRNALPPTRNAPKICENLWTTPVPSPPTHRKRALLATTLTATAALLAIAFLLLGNNPRLTLADVQSAVENQKWIHARFDAGQIQEQWTNLLTGETFLIFFSGNRVYLNDQTNTRLWYWPDSGVISQNQPVRYAPGQSAPPWSPHDAWESLVAPLEKATATTRPAGDEPFATRTGDTLNGQSLIRFDQYSLDALGHRFLYSQLWADPKTHLPVRIKTCLQLAERDESHKDWSTGDYDFPATGPADIYALGVPAGTPIQKEVTTAPATVQPILDAINHAHDNFIPNYRAVVITFAAMFANTAPSTDPKDIDSFDIVWRQGQNLREDRHLPGVELQSFPTPPLPKELSINALLAWADQHEPIEKQLMDTEHEYSWDSALSRHADKPRVQVTRRDRFPLLFKQAWPEEIEWPSRWYAPNFQLLPANAETPANCIGIRLGGEGNSRADFYIDPQNDYICIKQTDWEKRAAGWTKSREYTLSNLQHIAGHIVATTQTLHDFGDPSKHISQNTEITTIDLQPLTPADFPKDIFNPTSLTTGATIVGY